MTAEKDVAVVAKADVKVEETVAVAEITAQVAVVIKAAVAEEEIADVMVVEETEETAEAVHALVAVGEIRRNHQVAEAVHVLAVEAEGAVQANPASKAVKRNLEIVINFEWQF